MPAFQAMPVLRSKSHSCHWFQQLSKEFIYRQNYVFWEIFTLARFTAAFNGSYQHPMWLCCTARKPSCCQKSLQAWEYATQGKDLTGSWAPPSSSSSWGLWNYCNTHFITLLIQTGLSWGRRDCKTPGEASCEPAGTAIGQAGGISTFAFWEQHILAAAGEQTLFLHPCRRHTNGGVIFSGQELHHTFNLQHLIANATGGKSEDLQAVPQKTFRQCLVPVLLLLPHGLPCFHKWNSSIPCWHRTYPCCLSVF